MKNNDMLPTSKPSAHGKRPPFGMRKNKNIYFGPARPNFCSCMESVHQTLDKIIYSSSTPTHTSSHFVQLESSRRRGNLGSLNSFGNLQKIIYSKNI